MQEKEDKVYYFFTDGATSRNGANDADGGWAWINVRYEDEEVFIDHSRADYVFEATNNRCELMAVIDACKFAKTHNMEPATIYSDSAYVINCYKQKWYENWIYNGWVNYRREPVANKDLWKELIPFFRNKNYKFEKVKGHAGMIENETVDKMAKEAAMSGDIWNA
jgi:ribonuclease HI